MHAYFGHQRVVTAAAADAVPLAASVAYGHAVAADVAFDADAIGVAATVEIGVSSSSLLLSGAAVASGVGAESHDFLVQRLVAFAAASQTGAVAIWADDWRWQHADALSSSSSD